jgi:hypothetical protein
MKIHQDKNNRKNFDIAQAMRSVINRYLINFDKTY